MEEFKGPEFLVKTAFELIVNKRNNLRSISFLERGINLGKSVAFILVPDVGYGTGFMINEEILITNHHVLKDPDMAKKATIRFNYELDLEDKPLITEDFQCSPEEFFHTNIPLDYTVVKLKDKPGSKWGFIDIPNIQDFTFDSDVPPDVTIIQHPSGEAKMISITNNYVTYLDENIIQYTTDTKKGSSGSPVFDDNWTLVGLHHSAKEVEQLGIVNEGINIQSIKKDLASVM